MSTTEEVAGFVRQNIAARFDQMAMDLQRQVEGLQRQLEDLRAARGSMKWEIEGVGVVYLNIEGGKMTVADAPIDTPFMGVSFSAADWERFASGKVGGFMTSPNRQGFGQSRIARVRGIKGTVRFVVTGFPDGDWTSLVHFGPEPYEAPRTTIRIGAEVAEKVQKGELNPQMAFMQGQIRMEGDAALAMQVGMAMAM